MITKPTTTITTIIIINTAIITLILIIIIHKIVKIKNVITAKINNNEN